MNEAAVDVVLALVVGLLALLTRAVWRIAERVSRLEGRLNGERSDRVGRSD